MRSSSPTFEVTHGWQPPADLLRAFADLLVADADRRHDLACRRMTASAIAQFAWPVPSVIFFAVLIRAWNVKHAA
jgi:hypothetical protein